MKKSIGDFLCRLGIGLGSSYNGAMEYELKGFRPRPVLGHLEGMDYEWETCLPWYLERIRGNRILDVGYIEHRGLGGFLTGLGFEVWGIDIKGREVGGIKVIKAPIWDIEKWDVPLFDTIIVNSLLEHLHLPYYTEKSFVGAQEATMRVLGGVLARDGILLLQVPFGNKPIKVRNKGKEFYEVVTEGRLLELLSGFNIEDLDFFVRSSKGWTKVSRDIAIRVNTGGSLPRCLALVRVIKKDE